MSLLRPTRRVPALGLAVVALPLLVSPSGARAQTSLTDDYREAAGRLVGAALTDVDGWAKLEHLTTVIGHRLSGSEGLERAIAWADETMRAEGLDVTLQRVMVPHWVRGEEYARVVAPVERRLAILGLGGSVATPPEGLEAPIVVVGSFDELEALPRSAVEGRIVVFAVEWEGYGRTVAYRSGGASAAARKGAVAALVRSATGNSLYTPHTGGMNYAEDAPRIPTAAVTVEDAAWMRRMAESGETVRVRLYMEAETLPDAESANVIVEIPGRDLPDEVVVMGGHYDSWDVGQGAHDDGAPAIAAWHALTLVKRLGLQPRRTLRVVLWTNEENGLRGGNAYREYVGEAIDGHVAAIEMDGGAERPVGFGVSVGGGGEGENPAETRALALLSQIGRLLDGIEAGASPPGAEGPTSGPSCRTGSPGWPSRRWESTTSIGTTRTPTPSTRCDPSTSGRPSPCWR